MLDRVLWLAGMPRSGTTWVAQILASHPEVRLKYDPLFSYRFKNALDFTHGADDWGGLFRAAYATEDAYMDHEAPKREGLVPKFDSRASPAALAVKSNRHHDLIGHAVEIGVAAQFLFLVRDPVDTIASWLANPTEFPEGSDPAKEWRSGACRKTGRGEYWGFDDWVHVTALQLKLAQRFPDRVRLIRYEYVVSAADEWAREFFSWIGLDVAEQTRTFLKESCTRHSDHPRSVFRDCRRRPSHRATLPSGAEREMIVAIAGTPLAQFLRQSEEWTANAEG